MEHGVLKFRRDMKMDLTSAIRHIKLQSLLVLSILLAAVSVDAQGLDPKTKAEVLDHVSSVIGERAFVPGIDFGKWPGFMKEEKSEIEAAQTDEDFQKAVNSALKKFGASHVLLMTPRNAQIRRTGSTVGIGVSTQIVPEGLSIIRVVKDGPADKAGVSAGDTIIEVDGHPASTLKGLTGEAGSEVVVKVKRLDGTTKEFKIVRQKYSTVRPPELNWVDKDTAQLKLYSFEAGYDRAQISDLILQAEGAKNLVVDLRYNGGGLVSNLQHLLGMLIPDNKALGTFIRKSLVNEYVEKTGGKPSDIAAIAQWSERKFRPIHRPDAPFFNGKVVVLVNKFSGSASEIAAAALHDVIGAPVIGTKSAGAVLASVIIPASHGFMVQIPFEDYVTIKGVRLEGNGVAPDFEASDLAPNPKETKDPAIDKAIAYFTQAK